MADTIKIAELTIDSKKLVKELETTKKGIDDLTAKQKELKKAGDTSSATFVENEAKLKGLKKEYNSQIKVLQNVNTAQENLSKQLRNEVRSLEEAEESNKKLRQARSNLNLATKEGQDALNQINGKIDANTAFMKANQDEQINLKMNVGNYKDKVLEASGAQGAYTKGSQAMAAAQGVVNMVVGKSTGAMKVFRIALASTGIGLLVLALGSLVSYLTTTQEGINKVNMVLTPLKEVMGSLLGVAQDLGKKLFDTFSNPKESMMDLYDFVKQNLINRFQAFGVILDGIINLDFKKIGNGVAQGVTGVTDISDKIKNVAKDTTNFFKDAIDRGVEIERITQKLAASEAEFIAKQAELNKEFAVQKKLSDDTTKSQSEREEASRKALEIQKEISKGKIERIKQEAEILRLKTLANDTSDEDKAELARKLAEVDKAIEEEASKSTEAQNKLNSIVKSGIEERRKAREKAVQDKVAQLNEELALFEAKQAKSNTSDLQKMKNNSAEKLKILQYELDNKLISETAYETAKLNMQTEIDNKEAELKAEKANKDLDAITEFSERKKALEEEIYLAGLESDIEKEEAALELQQEKEEAEIERMTVSIERKNELKKLLEEKYQQEEAEIKRKYQEKANKDEEKREKAALANKRAIANARLDIAAGLSGLLGKLAGQDAKMQKASLLFEKGLAATNIIIQTQVANAKAIAASPLTVGQPWVSLNFAQMGIGLAAIAAETVASFQNIGGGESQGGGQKLAKGGILKGASHANGGIPTPYGELEGEEAVINKRSTKMYGGLLSAINEAGGGRKFASGGILGSGDIAPRSFIDYDMLANKMAQANMSLPSPTVSVSEISTVNKRVSVIESNSSF